MTTATNAEAAAAAVSEILKQEAERVRAISEQDWPALEAVLSDDYTHVHMPGRLEDKKTYVDDQKPRPRITERRDLKVRVYGDTAVMTGIMINRPPKGETVEAMVTQTWVKNGGVWQCAAFQASRIQTGG